MIGDRIKAERKARGWDQAALAAASGISHGYLRQLETNLRVSPKYATLQKLATAFGITVDELVNGVKRDITHPPSDLVRGVWSEAAVALMEAVWATASEPLRRATWERAVAHHENRAAIAAARHWMRLLEEAEAELRAAAAVPDPPPVP